MHDPHLHRALFSCSKQDLHTFSPFRGFHTRQLNPATGPFCRHQPSTVEPASCRPDPTRCPRHMDLVMCCHHSNRTTPVRSSIHGLHDRRAAANYKPTACGSPRERPTCGQHATQMNHVNARRPV
ncbi:unnamed protein product [Protopolystoma xenopodis]|uniref:Uncharacterized protein n=1 Tax=Protopolystoma xenopodis TaxID=117903 RepID=A0A448XED0_9PLAT|nr:unnamed protein product [Protopolystoma xenopodis]